MSNKTVAEHLAQYGDYHRDRRNIMTHLVGIPMIVIAILTLLSRPEFSVAYLLLTPANIVVFAAVIFYIRLDIKLGLLMTVLLWLCLSLGRDIAAMSTLAWLSWGIGLFIVGWTFQFIGHYYEGRKPAFVDDIIGLAIGPLFVVAEVVFMLGLRPELKRQVEQQR
ncbi:putative membrane protein YGL010W [Idiomarina aquatica]|uniref:Putative membrane protein YGL010W n=1 Tax=Idiomarina aquatica TaxID=1327752 RepID=A0A4R6PMG2_9GAMM|nr:Mpo1-like protein [Idiomarina aquatica]TDP39258.1 putative membrane protein YGL010W [Idiomarina aquatica]